MAQSYDDWYEKNKEERNKKRRDKYHSDPVYRAKRQSEVKSYSKKNPRKAKTKKIKTFKVRDNKIVFDDKGGMYVEIRVFRVTEVSKSIGVGTQTLRKWELKGWVPEPGLPGSHRFYTGHQIKLIKHLKEEVDKVPNKEKNDMALSLVESIRNSWMDIS